MKILLCGMVNYIWKCTGDIHNEINLKRENRELEFALREAELLLSLRCLSGETYPAEQVRDIYKKFLVNQFHDIPPEVISIRSTRMRWRTIKK